MEPGYDLEYHVVDREPLIVLMPSDHRLTAKQAIHPRELVGEIFIGGSNKAAVLRAVTEDYLRRSGVDIKLDHGVDNMAMAMSLVASTRGLALMPAYAKNLLPSSVVSRPLEGEAPTIDVAVGGIANRTLHRSQTVPVAPRRTGDAVARSLSVAFSHMAASTEPARTLDTVERPPAGIDPPWWLHSAHRLDGGGRQGRRREAAHVLLDGLAHGERLAGELADLRLEGAVVAALDRWSVGR